MRRFLGQGVFAVGMAALVLAPTASGGGSTAGAAGVTVTTRGTSTTTTGSSATTQGTQPPGTPSGTPPTLTVTPSTNLVTGQVVSVSGTGFTATPTGSAIAMAECIAGALGQTGCDLGNLGYPTADANGGFTVPFTVHRTILVGGQTVHCDDAPGTCILGASLISDFGRSAFVALSFDPNAPRPSPQVAVTPKTNLRNGDTVTVSGSGYLPNQSLSVSECAVGSPYCSPEIYLGEEAGLAVGTDGTFSVELPLRIRQLSAIDGPTDCLAATCEIRVRSYEDPDYDVAVAIAFDPTQPLPPVPTAHATPDQGLVDHQVVTVTGENFEAGQVSVRECLATNDGCRYLNIDATAGNDGRVSIAVPVRRTVRQYSSNGDAPVYQDCAVVACNLVLDSYTNFFSQSVTIPLGFDATQPLPPPPTVTADPATNLPFRTTISVTGHGFSANQFVYAAMCLQTDTAGRCGGYANGQTDANGDVTLAISVSRRANGYDGTVLDCVEAGTRCTVQIQSDDDEVARAAITFDPNAPIPPTPTVQVDPTTNLGWIQTVKVTGSGFGPNEQVLLQECTDVTLPGPVATADVVGPVFSQCAGYDYNNIPTADAEGNLSRDFRARKIITNGSSDPIDCSAAPGTCYLEVAHFDAFGATNPAHVPLSFDPTTPQPPGPPVTVTPAVGLSDGAVVTVAGSGFTPNTSIGMAVCAGTIRSISNCDLSTSSIGSADSSGGFQRQFTVRDHISTNAGTFDCAAAPGACVLGVANINDYIEFSLTPLSFGPDISISDVTVEEGTGANTPLPAMVHLSQAATRPVSVHWETTDGSAVSGQDYFGSAGDLIIPAGQTDAAVPADIVADAMDERTERFGITLSNAIGGPLVHATARVKIHDDDREPRITAGDMTVTEGDSGNSIGFVPVWLSNPSSRDVVISYKTHHGSARSGSDFVRSRGELTIAPGWAGGFIVIPIVGDHDREKTESFTVELRDATNASIGDDTATETIRDND